VCVFALRTHPPTPHTPTLITVKLNSTASRSFPPDHTTALLNTLASDTPHATALKQTSRHVQVDLGRHGKMLQAWYRTALYSPARLHTTTQHTLMLRIHTTYRAHYCPPYHDTAHSTAPYRRCTARYCTPTDYRAHTSRLRPSTAKCCMHDNSNTNNKGGS
jgi:hypothetical protein